MDEKFVFCDLKKVKTKTDYMYYIVVYSNLTEQAERIYITDKLYEQFVQHKVNPNINEICYRTYDTFNKKFRLMLKK